MGLCRRTSQARSDVERHPARIAKDRDKPPRGGAGVRPHRIVRATDAGPDTEVLEGHASVNRGHPLASRPPHVSASYPMQQIGGGNPRRLMRGCSRLDRSRRGRRPWARGAFAASSGDVRGEVIAGRIRTREKREGDDDSRVGEG